MILDAPTADPPLVSILVITYNQSHLIQETIESCLRQSYENFEIVVSDDGSTDATPLLLQNLQAAHPTKIKLVLNPVNRGITANCNAGLAFCEGEFIALMGGDDLLLPEKLLLQVQAFRRIPELTLSYHPCFVMRDGQLTELIGNRRKDVVLNLAQMIGNFGAQLPGPSTMVRAAAVPDYGFKSELQTASDWMFYIDVSARGRVERLDIPLAVYRQHDANVGHHYFSYSSDFLKTLAFAKSQYGERKGISKAIKRGGTRFLLGIIYRSVEQSRFDLTRVFLAELRRYSPRALWVLVTAVVKFPGIAAFFRLFKNGLKRYV